MSPALASSFLGTTVTLSLSSGKPGDRNVWKPGGSRGTDGTFSHGSSSHTANTPLTPPPQPSNPQFSPFPAKHLAPRHSHAILSRVYRAPSPQNSQFQPRPLSFLALSAPCSHTATLPLFLFIHLHTLLHFFALAQNATLVFSCDSALFAKNTGGRGQRRCNDPKELLEVFRHLPSNQPLATSEFHFILR
jgi:hypothetical protein